MKPLCVVIDGFSSGRYYVKTLKKAGYRCLHLTSRDNIPGFIRGCFCPDDYDAASLHEDIEQTIAWIREYGQPEFIVPGCEIGVTLADSLSQHFGVRSSNGTELSAARRDKYLMMERVREAGLRTIRQMQTSESAEALSWIAAEQLEFPIVVKPLASTSGEGFSLCNNEEDVVRAFGRIVGQRNFLNMENERALVQEFIRGDEYVIDTVSCEGKHVVSDCLRYEKDISPEGYSTYRACTFLPRKFARESDIASYAYRVLDALGVAHGPAHVEVMVDENGPVLIEVGARLAGCMLDPELIEQAYVHSQLSLSVLAYTDPRAFGQVTADLPEDLKLELELVYVSNQVSGTVTAVDFSAVEKLASYRKADISAKKGEHAKKTTNLGEAGAIIYLVHPERARIEADKKEIRSVESSLITIDPKLAAEVKASGCAAAPCGTAGTAATPSGCGSARTGPGVYVDANYLEYTATLCGAVKSRSYELCGVPADGGSRSLSVLDVGCGPGIDTVALAARLSSDSLVVGVDLDAEMIETANKRAQDAALACPVRHEVRNSSDLGGLGTFQCVRSERLLQHLSDPIATLRAMVDVLVPAGRLVIVDTDWSSLRASALSDAENERVASYYSTTLTNPEILKELGEQLRALGVEILEQEIIPVRLEREDYLKITKGLSLLEEAFSESSEREAALARLGDAGDLPMYGSVEIHLISGKKS